MISPTGKLIFITEDKNMYRKMVVIFVDLLGTKNNKRFEDKFLFTDFFMEKRKQMNKEIWIMLYMIEKCIVFLIAHIFSIIIKMA